MNKQKNLSLKARYLPVIYLEIVKQNSEQLILEAPVRNEWIIFILSFLASFITFYFGFDMFRILFVLMLWGILLLNLPKKEIWYFDKSEKLITKQSKLLNFLTQEMKFELSELQKFSIEESESKKGAYRLVANFIGGVNIGLTDNFVYSNAAAKQREIKKIIKKFLAEQQ